MVHDKIGDVMNDMINDEIDRRKNIDIFLVTGVNETDLTVNIKRFNVSEMVARNATITQLMLEMGKCKILCRQCHDAAHR